MGYRFSPSLRPSGRVEEIEKKKRNDTRAVFYMSRSSQSMAVELHKYYFRYIVRIFG